MAAWILPNDQWPRFAWEMIAEEGFELAEVELFSRANGGRLIFEARHVPLARAPLPVRQQCGIVQVLKRVKRAQRETIPGEHKFAVRAVARHPGYLQSVQRRKVQSALHGYGHW